MTLLVLILLHVKHQLTSNPLFIMWSMLWHLVHSIQYQMILRRSWVAMELEDLFLNWGNMSYKCHWSAKYPNVSKLHFWNSRPEALRRLELCMCQWQLLLRPNRPIGKTSTFGTAHRLHLLLYCVSVHAHTHTWKPIHRYTLTVTHA